MTKGKIAYLISKFPIVSHTFISREIKEMQNLGIDIACFAIHAPLEHEIAEEDKCFKGKVYYVFPLNKWELIQSHLNTFFKMPLRYIYWFWYIVSRPQTAFKDRVRCIFHFIEAIYLIKEMKNQHIKHIHVHFLQGNANIALLISKFLNITYSVTVHNSSLPMDKILQKEKIQHAKFLISISEYNKKKLLETDPQCENKIFVVHCGLDPKYFKLNPKLTKVFTILAVGRLTWEKSYPDLIKACYFLKNKQLNFKCIIVGEGGERQTIEKLINQYKLHEEIQLAGLVLQENIQDYYEQANLFVLSSETEGIPIVLMEAMSKGLPVVATNITGIPELVIHEKTGILVPVNHPQAFAGAVEYFIHNPSEGVEMGLQGRKQIEESFHIVKNVAQLKEIFESQLE